MLTILLILFLSGESWQKGQPKPVPDLSRSFVQNQAQGDDLLSFFPEELKGMNRQSVTLSTDKSAASAIYGNSEFKINVVDDADHGYKGVQEFEHLYTGINSELTDSVTQFTQVRNGYKTLNRVDKKRRQCSITFVYENRYIVQIEGLDSQTPYRLWNYLEFYKLNPAGNTY